MAAIAAVFQLVERAPKLAKQEEGAKALAAMARHGLDAAELERGQAPVRAMMLPSAELRAAQAAETAHAAAEKARLAAFRAAVDELWTWYVRWSLAARATKAKSRRAGR